MSSFHPHLLDRRLRVARAVVWAVMGLIVAVFFRTQILEHGKYRLQSEMNRLRPIPLLAPRGLIMDRNGKVLAENVPGYTVSLLPGDEDSLRAELRRLAPLIKLDETDIGRVLTRYRKAPYLPVMVLQSAKFDLVSALEERRVIFPGLLIQPEPKRHYPDSSLVAHLVGYVGEVTEAERGQRRFTSVRLGGLVGKDGLERQYDDSLRGADGVRFVEVSALGRVVREAGAASTLAPVSGQPLRTTIDLDLQRYVAQIFPAGQRGAVLALNPNTGEILALYSAPGFDPNSFVGGIEAATWRRLNESESHPLFDRSIQARYPPGSTWKLAVAAIALKRGLVTFHSHMPIPCRGGLQYGNRFFRCWSAQGHGDLSLADAIAQSCDVYFYQLGLKIGLSSLLEEANGIGFHTRTGVDLPGEITPEFPAGTEYYDRAYGPRRWTSAVTLNLAIGQGENAQTLVNMVRFYQMLASDGRARPPFLVHPGPNPNVTLGLSADQLAGLRQAMISVVERGTARGAGRFGGTNTNAGKTRPAPNPPRRSPRAASTPRVRTPPMRPRLREIDKPLAGVVLVLAAYGLATLYSAGQTDVPTFVATIWHRQTIWLAIGAAAMFLMFGLSPRLLEWATPYAYAITVLVLVFTLATGTGAGTAAGEKSWITIAGVRLGQPAELAKLAVILMLARWLAERREPPTTLRDLVYPCVIVGVPVALVVLQPDLGSAIVFIAILFAMLYWAGTKPSLLLLLGSPAIGLVLAFSTAAWGAWIILLFGLLLWWRPYVWEGLTIMLANIVMGIVAVPFWRRLAPYQQNRLLAFLNPEVDPRATGWHVLQSKIAIGSGGFLGKGFTAGPQKRLAFLPAQHTDFIFPVVGEELGFLGVMVALGLFVFLVFCLMRIARRATDAFSSLCVFGIASMLFTHIVENVGMTVNLLPITGIPLPFFSYGGSFLLSCSAAVGIALRVAWESRQSGYAEL